ncbi:hypothetical protein RchiOBHm_Chr7g0214411 [Rosa chinensis]|uniref:Uncharacterized protein n=1 Tax=Rosa chinensis TaxID=74649 RepID=A0A2P6PB76_ROSCH|nr:hypothetical protein RchiOBHm_Chr7g0214411 [Rosa chinensis]
MRTDIVGCYYVYGLAFVGFGVLVCELCRIMNEDEKMNGKPQFLDDIYEKCISRSLISNQQQLDDYLHIILIYMN